MNDEQNKAYDAGTVKNEKYEAYKRMMQALQLFRAGLKEVKEPNLAILDMKESKIVFNWDASGFVKDLELLLDAKPATEEEEMTARADLLLLRFGLKR